MEEKENEVEIEKLDSGHDNVRPDIDPIESTENHTEASKLQQLPKTSNLGPLRNPYAIP